MIYNSTKSLLEYVNELTGIDNFYILGSVAYNHMIEGHTDISKVSDIDIVIETHDFISFDKLCYSLVKKGFRNIKHGYYFTKSNPVYNIVASKDGLQIDIALVQSFEHIIGHFSIEAVYLKFPECMAVDRYDAIPSLLEFHKVFPVIDIEVHNPQILYGRMLKLCARFNLGLDEESCRTLVRLSERIMSQNTDSYFEMYYSRGFLLRRILKSFFSSNNTIFRNMILDQLKFNNLGDHVFFGLYSIARNILSLDNGEIKTYGDFISLVSIKTRTLDEQNKLQEMVEHLEEYLSKNLH